MVLIIIAAVLAFSVAASLIRLRYLKFSLTKKDSLQ